MSGQVIRSTGHVFKLVLSKVGQLIGSMQDRPQRLGSPGWRQSVWA